MELGYKTFELQFSKNWVVPEEIVRCFHYIMLSQRLKTFSKQFRGTFRNNFKQCCRADIPWPEKNSGPSSYTRPSRDRLRPSYQLTSGNSRTAIDKSYCIVNFKKSRELRLSDLQQNSTWNSLILKKNCFRCQNRC